MKPAVPRAQGAGTPAVRGLAPGRLALAASLVLLASPAPAADDAAAIALGRRIFMQGAQPSCTICHTLRDAGAEGAVGPSLDELKPDAARVARAVRGGIGAMPPYAETLSDDEIRAVALYVATAAGAASR